MCSGFRSEEMELCEMYFKSEAAYSCICELGELGVVQFVDLNSDVNVFHRAYTNAITMCEKTERKLGFIIKEIRLSGIGFVDVCEESKVAPVQISDLEAAVNKTANELEELNSNLCALRSLFIELSEFKHVIDTVAMYLGGKNTEPVQEDTEPLLMDGSLESIPLELMSSGDFTLKLNLQVGAIRREKAAAFKLMIWRLYHRNVFVHFIHIDTPFHDRGGDLTFKSVFVLVFQGDKLKSILHKICVGFGATLYSYPEKSEERRLVMETIHMQLKDLDKVLQKTSEHHLSVLKSAATKVPFWCSEVLKIKGIYHVLNMCKVEESTKSLVAKCWIPKLEVDKVYSALKAKSYKVGIAVPILTNIHSEEEPPTYHSVNKYTQAFQLLVDSYGINCYREMNPMPYNIVTFPFLFAVMFGDVGHGFILLLIGVYLCTVDSPYLHGELGTMLYTGRYIITLMGLFSMYTGLLYNECFGMSLVMFSSSWSVSRIQKNASDSRYWQLDPEQDFRGYPYVFGVDPVWKLGINSINLMNSIKMKLSIVLGVLHMIFGICLSYRNLLYFRLRTGVVTHFAPRVLFISLIFLYMVFLIVFKWLKYGPRKTPAYSIHCAPSILSTMILMVLVQKPVTSECNPYMFPHQYELQIGLLVVAFMCIPWMWFCGSLRCKSCARQPDIEETPLVGNSVSELKVPDSFVEEVHGGFVHRTIHTIEFVLSSVSHTASYLRLWALSLAHTQLSEVLWQMVLRLGLSRGFPRGVLVLFTLFTFWALLTLAILVVMEGLSAFLHTLRLHWVEFQSKFYHGFGKPFKPFSFSAISRKSVQSIEKYQLY